MQGKIIKKSVPNEPLIREKDDEKDSNEIVVENVQGPEEGKDEPQLRGARSRIKRNQPFRMDSSDGSSKSERTETKPDGTIVRTIVEVNGNQKKTTVITTKGGSTQTNTRIETIGGGGGGGRSGGRSGGFGFSGFDDSGFDDFNKRWNEQVNQMYNNFNNFGNDRNRGYHYEYNSSSGNGNKGGNKGNSNAWHYEWSSNSGSNNKNNNNNNNNNNKWYYEWGDNSNNNKKNYNNNNNISNNKKNDDWSYEWGTNTKDNKYNDNYQKQSETISGNEFQQSALDAHNKYRRKHHVGNLVLSKDLCNIAQKYAETMARTGNFAHSRGKYNGKNMGENLFACYGIKITGKMMTDDWYNEVSQYNFNNPGFVSGTGHFTQVVWKGSREVGFGFAQARDGYYYGVANYYPAGNYLGEFDSNVFEA
jgi:uncharacterized protein YkwD